MPFQRLHLTAVHVNGELYQQTLGKELRLLRKRRGWTRKQLNERLQSDISLQTLATYELGTRQCSVVRLTEICVALGEQPHELLERVDRAVFAPGDVQVDLAKVAVTDEPELLPLRRWAADRLAQPHANAQVRLNRAAIEHMAALCGLSPDALLDRLKLFTVGDSR